MNTRTRTRWAIALAFLLPALALAAACRDGGGSNGDGPDDEGTVAPSTTPGVGLSPAQAIGTLLALEGLDGHELDPSTIAECPLIPATPTPTPPPDETPEADEATPEVPLASRAALNQFCLTVVDFQAEESAEVLIELPETGEAWTASLEYDSGSSLWSVHSVVPDD
jgi:hypothetical protein